MCLQQTLFTITSIPAYLHFTITNYHFIKHSQHVPIAIRSLKFNNKKINIITHLLFTINYIMYLYLSPLINLLSFISMCFHLKSRMYLVIVIQCHYILSHISQLTYYIYSYFKFRECIQCIHVHNTINTYIYVGILYL